MSPKGQVFRCRECGKTSARWQGRCPECGAWNSLVEETVRKRPATARRAVAPVPLPSVPPDRFGFIATSLAEFDRVTGGGIPKEGSLLLAGEPGIGKSTLMLQALHGVSERGHKVLYVASEESPGSVRRRAERLGAVSDNILLLAETDAAAVAATVATEKPTVTVVDSIQMLRPEASGAPGSPAAVRDTAAMLLEPAAGRSLILVGHITKSGLIAGPKLLEHMVDTVLYFEGETGMGLRVLRALKNRFAPTEPVGVFMMREEGLTQVEDPATLLAKRRRTTYPGSAVGAAMFGSRVFLLEVQALVGADAGGAPGARRFAGLDFNRMHMLIAVLERRLGVRLSGRDVYVNLAGGMRVFEPAMDLAAAAAIVSSAGDIPLAADAVFIGEVGLSGEIRRIGRIEERLQEAARMGMYKAVVPDVEELPKRIGRLSVLKVADLAEFRSVLDTR